jgi:hypothetical protein
MKQLLLIVSGLFVAVTSFAQLPSGVHVQYVTPKGRGCAGAQVSVSIAPDGKSFSLLMDNYTAETTARLNLDLKSCVLEIGILAPAGYSFSLLSAD